jgi:hypothetical protein
VKALLDPSTQYFRHLNEVDRDEDGRMWHELLDGSVSSAVDELAWTIVWNESATDNDASVLLSLLLVTDNLGSPILSRLLWEADPKALFSNRLALKKNTWINTYAYAGTWSGEQKVYEFNGPLMEVMSQLVGCHLESFRSLLINYTRFYNPSTTLIYFIGHHMSAFETQSGCKEDTSDCPVRLLLEAGAQPNLLGYRLTPLQMAVAARDLVGVRLLLHFRADPNHVGDPNGVIWPTNSLLAKFSSFYGMSPLCIYRSGDCVLPEDDYRGYAREPFLETIEQLLLAFGGMDFAWEPSS